MVDRAWFAVQAEAYALAAAGTEWPLDMHQLHLCDDRGAGATHDAHYTPMDLWAAEKVVFDCRETDTGHMCPHVDVGSRVDGLCAHVLAAAIDVTHVDIREPAFSWPKRGWHGGLSFRRDDMRTLATFADASVRSLSCLHAAEHAGLGRYGDEIDPAGMNKAMASLARVLAPGGRLYFAVPIGRQRVVFNAHRIASPRWVISTFAAHGLTLESFAAVDDAGAWHPEARPEDYEGASYGCGCWVFTKGAA
jgi:hypothetical protein